MKKLLPLVLALFASCSTLSQVESPVRLIVTADGTVDAGTDGKLWGLRGLGDGAVSLTEKSTGLLGLQKTYTEGILACGYLWGDEKWSEDYGVDETQVSQRAYDALVEVFGPSKVAGWGLTVAPPPAPEPPAET